MLPDVEVVDMTAEAMVNVSQIPVSVMQGGEALVAIAKCA